MAFVINLGVADLAATRFAISPLCETIKALQLLARPSKLSPSSPLSQLSPPDVNLAWVRRSRNQLDRKPLRVPAIWPLVVTGLDVFPEFLVPAPASRNPVFEDELARLAATPSGSVRASLRRVFSRSGPMDTWPDSAIDLYERPEETLARITAELAECHDRLVCPYWERISSVLAADIGYRTGLLADGGVRALFGGMHPDLRWSAGTLVLDGADNGRPAVRVELGPDGLVIMPSVFCWPQVSVSLATSTQTVLIYPARGAATVWYATDHCDARGTAAEHLLGATRARLLATLRSPTTTTSLARHLGVTPGAVSQHLAFLRRGGLVDRHRAGRAVLYQVTELGVSLLARVP